MFRLRQFGVMVSSWLKKCNPFRKNQKLSLRATLFLQPLSIIFASFAIVLLIFNFAIGYFIDNQANRAVQKQYDALDALYIGSDSVTNSEGNIFATTYVIVDENDDAKYISTSMDNISEKEISRKITQYFYENDDVRNFFDNDNGHDNSSTADTENHHTERRTQIDLDDNTYVVQVEEYYGVLKDYFITQDFTSDNAKRYYVFVFANISPVENFDLLITIVLLILFGVIGIVASVVIYLTSRKIGGSFTSLKNYIMRVGNREANEQPKHLAYKEFNDVSDTVANMNRMIDANQRSQQIFFQNSSHELRTPLMSIQGYAEGIKEGVIKDEKQAASVIFDESQKMAELVDDILTLSKMEDTHMPLEYDWISVNDLLYDASWRLKDKADQNGLVFQHKFEMEHTEIKGDEKLLERAFLNIISNAVRYAKSTIIISTHQIGKELAISFTNDGPAISKEDQEHIFERFYKGQGGHFGIGLTITKEIVERHDGNISLQSNDKETTFTITLPIND